MKTKKKKNPNRRKKPIWKEKIERETEHKRGELSILTELQKGINVKGRACRTLKRKYKINKDNVIIINETVKQKMQLNAQRLIRYGKRNRFYHQNLIFKRDTKKFYREIGMMSFSRLKRWRIFGRIYGIKKKDLSKRLNG